MSFFQTALRAAGGLYNRLFRRRLDPKTREIAEVLREVPALSHLSSGALYAMAATAHRRSYRRGESLYYEDDPGLGLYVVESGRVRLLSDADPAAPRELCELEPPAMFGALSLLGDFPRLETAETVTNAKVLGFFRPDLKSVVRRNPGSGNEITLALARRVAAQHIEVLRRVEEQHGRDAALDAYAKVVGRYDSESAQ